MFLDFKGRKYFNSHMSNLSSLRLKVMSFHISDSCKSDLD